MLTIILFSMGCILCPMGCLIYSSSWQSLFVYSDLNENSTSVASDKIKAELRGNATNPTHELITLSLPAILGQAIDPFAQLMETAFIGRLGN